MEERMRWRCANDTASIPPSTPPKMVRAERAKLEHTMQVDFALRGKLSHTKTFLSFVMQISLKGWGFYYD